MTDHHFGNVHIEHFRNVIRQALDFDFAGDDLVNTALKFDALRIAQCDDGHLDSEMRFPKIDPLQVDVQQVVLDWVILPIDNHHRDTIFFFRDIQIEDGIVTGFAVQDAGELFGTDG